MLLLFNFALCYIISSCPNHVEFDLKVASFDKLAVVSLAATKWYIYLWIHMERFICLYVLLMYMYVHFLEIKYHHQQCSAVAIMGNDIKLAIITCITSAHNPN